MHKRSTAGMSPSDPQASISRKLLAKGIEWVWLLLLIVVLLVAGSYAHTKIDNAAKSLVGQNLEAVRNANVEAVRILLRNHQLHAESYIVDNDIRPALLALLAAEQRQAPAPDQLRISTEHHEVVRTVQPWMDFFDHRGFVLVTTEGKVIGSSNRFLVGATSPMFERAAKSLLSKQKTVVTHPSLSEFPIEDAPGRLKTEVLSMYAIAPIVENDNLVALFGLEIDPRQDFTRVLSKARHGNSAETYAFNHKGQMISQSRFDDQLKRIGLLTDNAITTSVLNIRIRDPGVNLLRTGRSDVRPSEQRLTRMAASAVLGNTGVDVSGYRDYRGVPVVGAWTWLPQYEFGIATEQDKDEALRPVTLIRQIFFAGFGVLAFASIATLFLAFWGARSRRRSQRATRALKQLGQYSLEEKLGEGGMGVVHRGHHAMLQRPTAVKFLHADHSTATAISRFEREVQQTSRLTHPNTISIYDYGRTDEGVFYYAMEFLEGLDLQNLIDQHGPQPDGRVIHILSQICGSLGEAHNLGLIHRDIKPSNIILTCRGGIPDFVKVLDFGLVKSVEADGLNTLTNIDAVTGTPYYISPESVKNPASIDARSDLYALGAVGFFLLTGRPVFTGTTATEVCMAHVLEKPPSVSSIADAHISPELANIIMQCLEKDCTDRPGSATELRAQLLQISPSIVWDDAKTTTWWRETDLD